MRRRSLKKKVVEKVQAFKRSLRPRKETPQKPLQRKSNGRKLSNQSTSSANSNLSNDKITTRQRSKRNSIDAESSPQTLASSVSNSTQSSQKSNKSTSHESEEDSNSLVTNTDSRLKLLDKRLESFDLDNGLEKKHSKEKIINDSKPASEKNKNSSHTSLLDSKYKDPLLQYSYLVEIGKGSYGTVYKAVDKESDQVVAIKEVLFSF